MKSALVPSLICCLLVACSSDDNAVEGAGGSAGTGGSDSGASDPMDMAPPEHGFQLRANGTIINGGQDVEYCEVVQLPGDASDVYYANHFEAALTQFSHHLNVYAVDPKHAVNDEVKLGAPHECLQPTLGYETAGASGEGFAYVTGSSRRYTESRLPEGVGKKLYGGQKLIFNYHYLNTSTEPVQAGSVLNIHTIEKEKVVHKPQMFTLLNQSISIPARAKASFTLECTMRQDIMVFGLTRHTHRWGTDFETWFAGGPRAGERVFSSDDWETNTGYEPEAPMLVRKGEGFRFRCDFNNTTDGVLNWGDKATDEMCILYGAWYVADPAQKPESQSCVALANISKPGPDGIMRGFPSTWPAPDVD